MIRADFEAFARAFNRLTLALPNRVKDDHAGEQLTASKLLYFDTLGDLPLDAVVAGADEILRSHQWFPAPVEWRRAALSAKFRFSIAALPAMKPGEVFCEVCNDTGFEQRVCQAGARCSEKHLLREEIFEHTFATPCDCRESNPVYIRGRVSMFGAPVQQIEQQEAKQLIAAAGSYSGKDRAVAERDE